MAHKLPPQAQIDYGPQFKLRVNYHKLGRLRYLSHLEVLRTIERIVRRSGLPYAVTQGFSPHMKIAFSAALPVGMGSYDEYFDLTMTTYLPTQSCLERLQTAAPGDLMVRDAAFVNPRARALTAALVLSSYEITLFGKDLTLNMVTGAIHRVIEEGSISYVKKEKLKQVTLGDKIVEPPTVCLIEPPDSTSTDQYEVFCEGFKEALRIHLVTRAQDTGSLRPDMFIKALDLPFERVSYVKRAQYGEGEDGSWISPFQLG